MSGARRNVELKARDPDPVRSLAGCLDLGAVDRGVIQQRDTYFNAACGGLKLREQTPGGPHLIWFERADEPQQRLSSYRTAPAADAPRLGAALGAALGVQAVVVKRRRLFLWQNVRIHLDEVEQLGTFIELEAVAAPHSNLSREHVLVAQLRDLLGIADGRLCAKGYAAQLRDIECAQPVEIRLNDSSG